MSSNIRRQKKEAYIKQAQIIKESNQERENILNEDHQLLLLCEKAAELNAHWERLSERERKILVEGPGWENFKFKMADALGKYKVGGVIFGKKAITARAEAELKAMLDKESAKKIKELDDSLKKQFSSEYKGKTVYFPNNKDKKNFISGVLSIDAVYKGIKAANDNCTLPNDVANELVVDLRKYMQKLMDFDLQSTFRFMMEEEEREGEVLEEEYIEEYLDEEELDEISLKDIGQKAKSIGKGIGKAAVAGAKKTKEFAKKATSKDTYSKENLAKAKASAIKGTKQFGKDITSKEKWKTGAKKAIRMDTGGETLSGTKHSKSMEGMASWRLPITLVALGASMGGLGWLTKTPWFKDLFTTMEDSTSMEDVTAMIEQKTAALKTITPQDGVYGLVTEFGEVPVNANSSLTEFFDGLASMSVKEGMDGTLDTINNLAHHGETVDGVANVGQLMMKPDNWKETFTALWEGVKDGSINPDDMKMSEIFKETASGTGKEALDNLGIDTTSMGTFEGGQVATTITSLVPSIVKAAVTTTVATTAGGYFLAKGLGAWLTGIGAVVIGLGAVVKAARYYGSKKSRLAVLNTSLQKMDDLADACNCKEGEVYDSKQKKCVGVEDVEDAEKKRGEGWDDTRTGEYSEGYDLAYFDGEEPSNKQLNDHSEEGNDFMDGHEQGKKDRKSGPKEKEGEEEVIDTAEEEVSDEEKRGIWKRLKDWFSGEGEQVPPAVLVKIPDDILNKSKGFKRSRNLQYAFMLALGGVPVPPFTFDEESGAVETEFTGDNTGAGPNARQIINMRKAAPRYFLSRLGFMFPGVEFNKQIRATSMDIGEKGKRNLDKNMSYYTVETAPGKQKVWSTDELNALRKDLQKKWQFIFRNVKISSGQAASLEKMWRNKKIPNFLKNNFGNYAFTYSSPDKTGASE